MTPIKKELRNRLHSTVQRILTINAIDQYPTTVVGKFCRNDVQGHIRKARRIKSPWMITRTKCAI